MQATETFAVGAEQVTVTVEIDLGTEQIITGDFSGSVPAGTVGRLRGSIRLLADLHVRGTLVADPSGVDLDGQGLWDIHTHDGGVLNLQGVEKTAWCHWGDTPVGWNVGDRLAVAPTAVGVYTPSETTWMGLWSATTRPTNSPDVMLVDGSVARPEVVNLSQSLLIRNVTRIMMHEADGLPNVHTLKWLKVLNSGKTNELTFYPIHFHLLYDSCRGSVVHGVVVEGGKNHAFVPHGSHGITYTDCVAYNTLGPPFWWDAKIDTYNFANDSDDIIWNDCLALWVKNDGSAGNSRHAGFVLGSGVNPICTDSVAVGVHGNPSASESNRQRSGFTWPEGSAHDPWLFQRCLGHNNVDSGILVWQNRRDLVNLLEDFTAYRNGFEGVNHGSYTNRYHYSGVKLTGNGFRQHAKSSIEGPMVIEDVLSDTRLYVTTHASAFPYPSFYRRCTFPSVKYAEGVPTAHGSYNIYEDCGLVPSMFDLAGIASESIIEIKEGGVLTHRWQSGVWS